MNVISNFGRVFVLVVLSSPLPCLFSYGQMYDPNWPGGNQFVPNPTQHDIMTAEHSAFMHGSCAAEAMSNNDTWRAVEEQSMANRARQDVMAMRLQMEENARRDRDACLQRKEAEQEQQNRQAQCGFVDDDELMSADQRLLWADPIAASWMRFLDEVKWALPKPFPFRAEYGHCRFCNARILGRYVCNRCSVQDPPKLVEWILCEEKSADDRAGLVRRFAASIPQNPTLAKSVLGLLPAPNPNASKSYGACYSCGKRIATNKGWHFCRSCKSDIPKAYSAWRAEEERKGRVFLDVVKTYVESVCQARLKAVNAVR